MPALTEEIIRTTIHNATLYEQPARWRDFTVTPEGDDLVVTFEAWEMAKVGVGWVLHPNTERVVSSVHRAANASGWEVCNSEPDIMYPNERAPFGIGRLLLKQKDYDGCWS